MSFQAFSLFLLEVVFSVHASVCFFFLRSKEKVENAFAGFLDPTILGKNSLIAQQLFTSAQSSEMRIFQRFLDFAIALSCS